MVLKDADRRLIAVLERGLPLVERPYAALGEAAGMTEAEAIACLRALEDEGVIKRLGLIVRHHELGYRANAMVVWDVADARVDAVGDAMGRRACVTLCYRRPRRPPRWPYNLYCMIHGRDRARVERQVEEIAAELGLEEVRRELLFSARRFKQRGARYVSEAVERVA
jgi:DNA-binding Lrp family transcriptional regulator